jgi:hypothetical protein
MELQRPRVTSVEIAVNLNECAFLLDLMKKYNKDEDAFEDDEIDRINEYQKHLPNYAEYIEDKYIANGKGYRIDTL